MLINSASKSGSLVLELVFGVVVVGIVGVGVHHVQHPHLTQQQQITAAFQE